MNTALAPRQGPLAFFAAGDVIYSQGDSADQVMYIESGCIKLSVLSSAGKFGVVAMLSSGQFFGEGSLAGQPYRTATAHAVGRCSVISMSKTAMEALLYRRDDISSRFIAHILTRNVRIEDDLIDHLFHPAEKRLARALLLLANDVSEGTPLVTVPPIAQETLAEMIGTTRSRVNFFLNKFKNLGFIEYLAGQSLTVNTTALTALLYD